MEFLHESLRAEFISYLKTFDPTLTITDLMNILNPEKTSIMIDTIPGIQKVGKIIISGKIYQGPKHVHYKNKLELVLDAQLTKKLSTQHLSIAYIFTINGRIAKIGQTSGKGGIKACMSFYCNAGQDDPGPNRWAINWKIREQLELGHVVEVYMIYMSPIKVIAPGLWQTIEIETPVSAKCIEENCLHQFKEKTGRYPEWNYQENGQAIESEIQLAHTEYKRLRRLGNV